MSSSNPAPGRRRLLLAASALLLTAGCAQAAPPLDLVVYKTPYCGCCKGWISHMAKAGFKPTVHEVEDLAPVRDKQGVPFELSSCHTGVIGGYVVEGHVPAADVRRMLTEKPAIAGISAPGMPMGSPGMEGPYPADRYDVVSFDAQGRTAVYASH